MLTWLEVQIVHTATVSWIRLKTDKNSPMREWHWQQMANTMEFRLA